MRRIASVLTLISLAPVIYSLTICEDLGTPLLESCCTGFTGENLAACRQGIIQGLDDSISGKKYIADITPHLNKYDAPRSGSTTPTGDTPPSPVDPDDDDDDDLEDMRLQNLELFRGPMKEKFVKVCAVTRELHTTHTFTTEQFAFVVSTGVGSKPEDNVDGNVKAFVEYLGTKLATGVQLGANFFHSLYLDEKLAFLALSAENKEILLSANFKAFHTQYEAYKSEQDVRNATPETTNRLFFSCSVEQLLNVYVKKRESIEAHLTATALVEEVQTVIHEDCSYTP